MKKKEKKPQKTLIVLSANCSLSQALRQLFVYGLETSVFSLILGQEKFAVIEYWTMVFKPV